MAQSETKPEKQKLKLIKKERLARGFEVKLSAVVICDSQHIKQRNT